MGRTTTGDYAKVNEYTGEPFDALAFGARVRSAREARSLTMREAAAALNVATNTVCNIEMGRNAPTAKLLYRMAQVYGVSVDWLVGTRRARGAR